MNILDIPNQVIGGIAGVLGTVGAGFLWKIFGSNQSLIRNIVKEPAKELKLLICKELDQKVSAAFFHD